MKVVGIAIDSWKLSIFERRLKQAGYTFENRGEFSKACLLLRVSTENVEALQEVVRAANTEAAMTGAPI